MPEGDTIHAVAAELEQDLCGKRVRRALVTRTRQAALEDVCYDEVFAVGKHLFFAAGETGLRTHMGMHGSWHRYRPGEPWQRPAWTASVELELADRVLVCFRPAEVEIVDFGGPRHAAFLRRLGPDILAPDFDPAVAVARARERAPETPLIDVLLDQTIAAGIGNVYKSELAFLGALHPLHAVGQLESEHLRGLYAMARDFLRRNVVGGARRLRGPRPAGSPGASAPAADGDGRLWVYGRRGERCSACAAPIETAHLGRHRRITYWCPRCQPESLNAHAPRAR